MAMEEKHNGRRSKRKRIPKDPGKPVRYEAVKWDVSKEQIFLTLFDFPNSASGNNSYQ
jgi:hypothetical protein